MIGGFLNIELINPEKYFEKTSKFKMRMIKRYVSVLRDLKKKQERFIDEFTKRKEITYLR